MKVDAASETTTFLALGIAKKKKGSSDSPGRLLPQLSKSGSFRRAQRVFKAYLSILSDASTEVTSNFSSTSNTESILLPKS